VQCQPDAMRVRLVDSARLRGSGCARSASPQLAGPAPSASSPLQATEIRTEERSRVCAVTSKLPQKTRN